jgi:YVTN family beta-propeller protein
VSADSVNPIPTSTGQPDAATPTATGRRSRRRITKLSWAAGIAVVVIGAPTAAFGIAGSFGTTHGTKVANTPQSNIKYERSGPSAFRFHPAAGHALPATTGDFDAYVAAAGGDEVLQVDVSTDTITGAYGADTAEGVAVTPNNSPVFIAETGQYDVIPVNVATGAEGTPIEVGAYPQDVAVSPDGSTVYATLTGGDTGPGGSSQVAVISTATGTVTGDITVGTGPRQVAFSPDGTRAYVTTENGVDVIDTAANRVIAAINIPTGAQGLAVSPNGSTVYVTSPQTGQLVVISTARDRVVADIPAGAEPYAVAVTPDGSTAYVTDMNSDSVMAINTATDRTAANIAVGELPGSVAVTPDGSQLWVGNILDGDITVISPATNTVVGTIDGAPGVAPPPASTGTLDGAPLGITFVGA